MAGPDIEIKGGAHGAPRTHEAAINNELVKFLSRS